MKLDDGLLRHLVIAVDGDFIRVPQLVPEEFLKEQLAPPRRDRPGGRPGDRPDRGPRRDSRDDSAEAGHRRAAGDGGDGGNGGDDEGDSSSEEDE